MTQGAALVNAAAACAQRALFVAGVWAFLPAVAADWSPRLAAHYLDSRQQEWFSWSIAAKPGGPCMSCHTGMTYLLARPKLRRALGEAEPTKYEEGLRDALRARLDHAAPLPADAKPLAVEAAGTESVLAALLLPQANAEKAFNRLWGLQAANGAWPWFSLDLDPWETEASQFYGAALAAAATASLPLEYRNRAGVREHVAALKSYLAGAQKTQPLHNRLALLWAASRWNALLPAGERREIVAEALEKQQPDGGWTLECLGPWKERSTAPPGEGSNAYATGFTAFVLQEAGCKPTDRAIGRARRWLASHQDAETGSWPASSMNKRYEPGSMQIRFMQDAATAFAALALLE